MGGLDLELDIGGGGPDNLRWISDLEQQRRPPINSLFRICANYVSKHLEETVLIPVVSKIK